MAKKHDIVPDSSAEDLINEDESAHKSENKLMQKIIAAVAIAAASMVLLFFIAYQSQKKTDSYFAVIYSKQGGDYFDSSKGGFELKNDSGKRPVISKDSKTLFYFTASKTISNKLDLYCCDLTSKRQISKGGFIVDSGVGSDINLNDSGSFVIYSKKNDSTGETIFYLFDTKKKKATRIDSSIKELYILSDEDGAFYTKIKDSKTALFKYTFYSKPVLVSDSVRKITFYNSADKSALLFETYEDDPALFGLNIVLGLGEAKLVSESVSNVLYEQYVANGNLYYFKATNESTTWEEIITDDIKLQDEKIVQPDPNDYKFIFGYNYNYRKALTEYQAKSRRDELRASLTRIVNEENLIAERTDCYVYNNDEPVKVGKGVSSDNIFTASSGTDAAIVYNKHAYETSETKFSKLSEMLVKRDVNYISDYAADIIRNATAAKGVYISIPANTDGISLNITDVESQGSEFGFSTDGKSLFMIMKDAKVFDSTFFRIGIEGGSITRKEVIDVNIASFDFTPDSVWYLKLDDGSNEGALYRYTKGNKAQIISSVFSFVCFDDGDTLIFRNKKQNQSGLSADLYLYSGENSVLIDENVDLHHLRYKNSKEFAYIKNYSEENGGELCVFVYSAVKPISGGINNIVLY